MMARAEALPRGIAVRPRVRVMRGAEIVLGPGKADLLEGVRALGSLRKAADALGMSYMRAWSLVKAMNAAFSKPLVTLARGGAGHGGATLTPTGAKVLALYRSMETRCSEAVEENAGRMRRFLRR